MNKEIDQTENVSYSINNKNIFKSTNENYEENNNNDSKNSPGIKKAKTLRSSTKNKNKEKKRNRKASSDQILNSKKVKFSGKIDIIDVESYKKYNLEQTADENFEEFLKMEYENENKGNSNENKDNPNNKNKTGNKRIKDKQGNVSCTCNII